MNVEKFELEISPLNNWSIECMSLYNSGNNSGFMVGGIGPKV